MQSLWKIETWFQSEELPEENLFLVWFIIFAQTLRGRQEPRGVQGKPSKLPFLSSPTNTVFHDPWSWKSFKDFLSRFQLPKQQIRKVCSKITKDHYVLRSWNHCADLKHWFLMISAFSPSVLDRVKIIRVAGKCRLCCTSLKIYKRDSCLKDCSNTVDHYPCRGSLSPKMGMKGGSGVPSWTVKVPFHSLPSGKSSPWFPMRRSLRQRGSLGCHLPAFYLFKMEMI